jgi:hypothetical protein
MKVNRLFGGTFRIHLQGLRVSKARKEHEAGSKRFSTYYTALYRRK